MSIITGAEKAFFRAWEVVTTKKMSPQNVTFVEGKDYDEEYSIVTFEPIAPTTALSSIGQFDKAIYRYISPEDLDELLGNPRPRNSDRFEKID